MKQEFLGYYSPSEEDFEKLWSECTFVFDANMLINLYRFPRNSREALITIMESVQERIWIPHQVALEYHKLLHDEIYNQKNAYSKFEEQCTNSINGLVAELVSLRHSNIESKGIEKVLKDCLKKINDELKKQAASQPDLVAIQDKVTQLIGDKVGKPYTKDQLNKLYEEGEARYNDKIPPGYKDLNDKKGKTTLYGGITYKNEYGDFIYWKQIIEKVKEDANIKSIILVTDDNKDDWVHKVKGEKKGPHPELVYEFNKECDGKQFYLYNSERFLQFAKKLLKLEDTFLDTAKVTGAIEGIKELKKSDYQFELSNTRKSEFIKETSINIANIDFPYKKSAKKFDYDLNNDSEEYRVNFVLSLEGQASRKELSNFGETIENALMVLYDLKAWVNLKHNAIIGDTYYHSFEIIGATKVKDQLPVLLNSVALSSFSSKNAAALITN